jgi:GNAT superfamily N-acetyltransferase
MEPFERRHHGYLISTDPALVDVDLFHRWIAEESYWAAGRSRAVVESSLQGSMVFGAYTTEGDLVGAARVVTDRATFAWLCDVFVLEPHRGAGLGKALVAAVVDHPDLRDLQRIVLATADAHALYTQFGFEPLPAPERFMVRSRPPR